MAARSNPERQGSFTSPVKGEAERPKEQERESDAASRIEETKAQLKAMFMGIGGDDASRRLVEELQDPTSETSSAFIEMLLEGAAKVVTEEQKEDMAESK
jgi:hypothetical protein